MNTTQKFLWTIRYELKLLFQQIKRLKWRYRDWQYFWQTYDHYVGVSTSQSDIKLTPILGENTRSTPIEPIYFYQDAWAFERIIGEKPEDHVDVGSHHKFVALLSKVTNVTMVDIRPLSLPMESIHFREGSILALPFEDNSLESISSLCVVEHIGLGRYGDPIDELGTEKAIKELMRVVKPGGNLYLSLPLDSINRVYFNAHRAFSESTLEHLFEAFTVVEKKYIFKKQFLDRAQDGFGVGCYHLKAPIATTTS